MKINNIIEGKTTNKVPATKPRNFVAKNAIQTGAGAHKDKKKASKQGDVKHKKKEMELAEGWKDKLGAAALVAAPIIGGIGANMAAPNTTIQGHQAQLASSSTIPDNAKLVTDEKGNKVYVWTVTGSNPKSAGSHKVLVYRPAEEVKEGSDVVSTIKNVATKVGDALSTALPKDMRPFDYETAAKASTAQKEARANTKAVRTGLAKREKRADPTMDAKKQSEQDAAWERLQAHMNKPENMAVLKRLATKEGTDMKEDVAEYNENGYWDVYLWGNWYRGKWHDFSPRKVAIPGSSEEEARDWIANNADKLYAKYNTLKGHNGRLLLRRPAEQNLFLDKTKFIGPSKSYKVPPQQQPQGELNETELRDREDLQAKRKALQDIQMDPHTHKDKDLSAELARRKAELEREAQVKRISESNTNRLWQMITDLEKRAKSTSNDIKRDHLLKMADDLRAKLPTNDMDEGYYRRPGSPSAYNRDVWSSTAGMGKRDSYAYQMDGGANDEGWDEEPQSRQRYQAPEDKPVLQGYFFYDVPAGKEQEAAIYGVKPTKSGKWAKAKYTTSGRSFDMQKDGADKAFGPGKWWAPKK